ncbi:DMBT1 protein, partial [Scytalopus superciliaris]|nr:DMBT1 protein [Scytalopus superciliaris]
ITEVNCAGHESFLWHCPYSYQYHVCHHGDASVICSGASVRLVNGRNRCEGRVEISHSGVQGTVCDTNWDLHEANIVCRELGCGFAVSAPSGAVFGPGSGVIYLDDVNCAGWETSLFQCSHRGWGVHSCQHSKDASVVCS